VFLGADEEHYYAVSRVFSDEASGAFGIFYALPRVFDYRVSEATSVYSVYFYSLPRDFYDEALCIYLLSPSPIGMCRYRQLLYWFLSFFLWFLLIS
jgi:hypothetical protein